MYTSELAFDFISMEGVGVRLFIFDYGNARLYLFNPSNWWNAFEQKPSFLGLSFLIKLVWSLLMNLSHESYVWRFSSRVRLLLSVSFLYQSFIWRNFVMFRMVLLNITWADVLVELLDLQLLIVLNCLCVKKMRLVLVFAISTTLNSVEINPFQPSVTLHLETSHLVCVAHQMAGFYMKCITGLKCVNLLNRFSFLFAVTLLNWWMWSWQVVSCLVQVHYEHFLVVDHFSAGE